MRDAIMDQGCRRMAELGELDEWAELGMWNSTKLRRAKARMRLTSADNWAHTPDG